MNPTLPQISRQPISAEDYLLPQTFLSLFPEHERETAREYFAIAAERVDTPQMVIRVVRLIACCAWLDEGFMEPTVLITGKRMTAFTGTHYEEALAFAVYMLGEEARN
jgi:hypothetical protein